MEWGTVGLFLPKPGQHILAEREDLAELWQGVVLERLDRLSVVEFLYAVSLFRAEIIHFEVLLVLLLQEPFDVIQRVRMSPTWGFRAKPYLLKERP